jgi:3-hydroxyisobutyrate dehydrogenase-like beta-hydroxyacid dehydrogenase
VARGPGDGLRVAVLGLGEAGAEIAADLVSTGADVAGWDPDPSRRIDGVRRCASGHEAAEGADVVLGLSSATAALAAAADCAPALGHDVLYADLNTTAPAVKVELAAIAERAGAAFADVALMAPVPGRGIRTPALASGGGAARFAGCLAPLGMPVEIVDGGPGAAATRKLLRSVFMKGVAASALECLAAADAAGCETWLRAEIERVLEDADGRLLDRLVQGSALHAARRTEEMESAAALLGELGIEPRISAAAAQVLADLASAKHAGAAPR